ncbi:MAG: UbiX family flavin prenyltransferase [Planctomycetota bacterium]|nr:MAG: UbiX family flavin prenyltransferase [Planctomycetota bacterium]REJ89798.1 MAG: UbiX family flavin prenyltransferase [Planctomycetota bacterium]REK21560.1 MAG: UbiX family flavin prenyltransferase [Planctomycetota bacterium]REK39886.1 MAG: UbiX family flavin prenyltransferase [Planctomycetota bacterium]
MSDLVLAMTGASGAIYSVRLLHVLLSLGRTVHLSISPAAVQVLREELDLKVDLENFDAAQILPAEESVSGDSKLNLLRGQGGSSIFSESDARYGRLVYHHYQDYNAGIASGSFPTGGMVICPCSMGTLGSLASGLSSNLIHRAAGVHLKERRKLIVVPRETPLSGIQLASMKTLSDAGAVILPAMPGFYHNPLTIHDLVDFVVTRICDQLQAPVELMQRWGTE